MINLAILIALNNAAEIGLHVRAALASGVSVDEIERVLVHATKYCGISTDLEAIITARKALNQCGAT